MPCSSGDRLDVEADQDALLAGEVADDLADRLGELAHERRHGEDLVAGGELGVDQQVDHLDLVAAGEVLLAHPLQIGERGDRLARRARDVEAQLPLRLRRLGRPGRPLDGSALHAFLLRATWALGGRRAAFAACAPTRRRPVSGRPASRKTSTISTPRSLKTNSRTRFECGIPRDLMICSARVRSPSTATFDSISQTSINDETPSCVSASVAPSLPTRLVYTPVMWLFFMKSMSRINIGFRPASSVCI